MGQPMPDVEALFAGQMEVTYRAQTVNGAAIHMRMDAGYTITLQDANDELISIGVRWLE